MSDKEKRPEGSRQSLEERFRAKTQPSKETGCIMWLGGVSGAGYGQIDVDGRKIGAHRVAYELAHGPIPDGQLVRHTCNQPLCVNPAHLLIGTHQDNANDMIAAGRAPVRSGRKLSDRDVTTMWGLRILGWLQKDIAAEYNVALGTVQAILNNRSRADAIDNELDKETPYDPAAQHAAMSEWEQ